jgi:hypothetical protein
MAVCYLGGVIIMASSGWLLNYIWVHATSGVNNEKVKIKIIGLCFWLGFLSTKTVNL